MIRPHLCDVRPNFYPRSPCGERPLGRSFRRARIGYFYPRSPCGERPSMAFARFAISNLFLSTLSLRRATPARSASKLSHEDFYPRSPCGERHKKSNGGASTEIISIHALLAESDRRSLEVSYRGYISIHALLAESDTRRPTALL